MGLYGVFLTTWAHLATTMTTIIQLINKEFTLVILFLRKYLDTYIILTYNKLLYLTEKHKIYKIKTYSIKKYIYI